MQQRVLRRHAVRFATIILIGSLCGLFVFYGTLEPAPKYNDYPGDDELAAAYDNYVGHEVTLSGSVVATEPVILEVDHATGTDEYVIRNAPNVDVGQDLRLFGTAHPDRTLEVHDAIVRESWERTYMYAISVLAALWIVARALKHWQFDSRSYAFIPRNDGDHDA